MSKANTAPLSGMRDFLPLDVLRRNYVIGTIERVYQSYGFEPLQTPALERLETLLGKYGEEGDQLIFRVLKRGEELQRALDMPGGEGLSDMGLRYDLTVPLARVVAEYRQHLPRIFKRYQIQSVYRADRPAKGRFREFYQCDVDIVGSRSAVVEAEVINAAAQVLQALGFQGPEGFRVRLNHRGVLRGLMEVAGIPPEHEGSALVAVDKLDKIRLEGVRKELHERGIEPTVAAHLLDLLSETPEGNEAILTWLNTALAPSAVGTKSVHELRAVVNYCAHGPSATHLKVDPYLARGLSYYTGPIFEIEFPGLTGSGGGGGRYDGLIGMFSGQDIPACGFSLGLERILVVLEERGMFPERLRGQPEVLATQYDDSTIGATLTLAERLRTAGLRVDVYPEPSNYGKQFKYAEQRRIRYALLLSHREQAAEVVAVKDLVSGEQVDVEAATIVAWLQQRLSPPDTGVR